jgi:hypothetical protein
MSSSFRSCLASIAIVLTALPAPAKADTYKISVVDMTQDENFQGIDDQGNFIINDANSSFKCGELNGPCFEVFLSGQSPFFTITAPVLNYDNGTPCTIALSPGFGQPQASGVCNNGHEIFGVTTFNPDIHGIYDGLNLSDLVATGLSFDGGYINASGDAVFINGLGDELIFAQDLTSTTPEPSSLYLLGTGCLAMLGTLRRHRRAAQ